MIEIVNNIDSHSRQVWKFYWENPFHIWLDSYSYQTLKPRCRKWDIIKIWTRISSRDYFTKDQMIPEPQIDTDLEEKVLNWIKDNTKIESWSRR